MKIKLKGNPIKRSLADCVDGKYLGIDLRTWKKIDNGSEVDLPEIPKEAESYLVSVENKNKNKKKQNEKKIGENHGD